MPAGTQGRALVTEAVRGTFGAGVQPNSDASTSAHAAKRMPTGRAVCPPRGGNSEATESERLSKNRRLRSFTESFSGKTAGGARGRT